MEDEIWVVLRAPDADIAAAAMRMSDEAATQVTATSECIPASAVADLVNDPATIAAAPDMPTSLIEPFSGPSAVTGDAWGIAAVGADLSAFDGSGVRVAVLDTGIDVGHPCFAGMNIVQQDFSGSGNGDVKGHGTHCAGTIFGRDVGGRIGVARGVTEAFIGKVLDDTGRGTALTVLRGMQWAVNLGAKVISMSLGFDTPGLVEKLIAKGYPPKIAAAQALSTYQMNLRLFDRHLSLLKAQASFGQDALIIAATGNASERATNPAYRVPASLPAAAEGVLSVGALQQSAGGLTVTSFSNSLPALCAPGFDVRSAWPGGGTKTLAGTSMACPHVAGLAALWWQSLGPNAGADSVSLRLRGAAQHAALKPGFNHTDVGLGLARAP